MVIPTIQFLSIWMCDPHISLEWLLRVKIVLEIFNTDVNEAAEFLSEHFDASKSISQIVKAL